MSPKLTFTIGSAITFLFSAAFFVAPEFFTMTAFPAAKGFAIDVGITMRYVLAATIFGVCCLLFQARSLERESDKKTSFWVQLSVLQSYVRQLCMQQFFVSSGEVFRQLLPPV